VPDSDPDAPAQLYQLGRDPGERENLHSKHPEIAERMKRELERLKTSGRSIPWPRP
jgi:arylsulfatase A